MPVVFLTKTKEDQLPERRNLDFYPAEITLVQETVKILAESIKDQFIKRIIDPGAGDGRWGLEALKQWPEAELVCVDIDPEKEPEDFPGRWVVADFRALTVEEFGQFDLVIGNPPYGEYIEGRELPKPCVEEFVAHACSLLANNGHLAYLLKRSFGCGVNRRKGFFPKYPIYREHPCARRPSFYGGRTNTDSYSIFRWAKNDFGNMLGIEGVWLTCPMLHKRVKP